MILRAIMLGSALACAFATSSDAKPRIAGQNPVISCTDWVCAPAVALSVERRAFQQPRRLAENARPAPRRGTLQGYADREGRGQVSLAGVVAPLAEKAREIVSACGSSVISALRNTRVRGSGRISLHASGHAVDIRGNPTCIYAHLQGWPGGYSIDYRRRDIQHVHISYSPDGREWGARFAHWQPRKKRVRLAHVR